MSSRHRPGRHELGQNYLRDRRIIATVARLAGDPGLPLVEWAAGEGAITTALAALGHPVEAVELDPRNVRRLRRASPPHVCVTEGDILRHAPPAHPHVLVSNVPFHLTTAVLRRLLRQPHWERAVLVTQWEVARKRAGVGGATQLTAQWWPWYAFDLVTRIPATAFVPRPSVDGGLLLVTRRTAPLLADTERAAYQRWVPQVFGGPGRGLPDVLVRAGVPRTAVRRWCRDEGLTARHLPRDLSPRQWVDAFRLSSAS